MAGNARRLSRGRGADLIGAKIDAARLKLIQYRFASALRLLDDGKALAFSPGSSRDVLLELLAVRARFLTDAASFAMASYWADADRFGPIEAAELKALAVYARIELRPCGENAKDKNRDDGRELSRRLCHQARNAHQELSSVLQATPGSRPPYQIFAEYLDVWLRVVASRGSREEPTEDEQKRAIRKEVQEAYNELRSVIRSMEKIGYRMHHREANFLREGLESCLSRPS